MHERVANLLGATALTVADLMLQSAVTASGVNATAAAALTVLSDSDGLGVTELGRRVGVTQSAAARMVDLLAGHELVRRQAGQGREVGVFLTPAGATRVGQLLAARTAALASALDEFEPDDLKKLAVLLESLLRTVHAHGADANRICRLCDRAACIAAGNACPVGKAAKGGAEHGSG